MHKIKFNIISLPAEAQFYYQLTLDYSAQVSDCIDRKALLIFIAQTFNIQIEDLFEAGCIPSLSAMKKVSVHFAT